MSIETLRRCLSAFSEAAADDSGISVGHDREIDKLLDALREFDPATSDALWAQHPDLVEWRPLVATAYTQMIRQREIASARDVIDSGAGGGVSEWTSGFARQSYDRVRDMFETVNFTGAKRFVMVGCGPLPVTMLQVFHNTSVPEIVGLDVDADALTVTRQLFEVLNPKRLSVELIDGSNYDFADADIVYIANLISPKQRVLEQVARTVASHTRIILRDPFAMGRLFAEPGALSLPAQLIATDTGDGDRHFLSRHIFLRCRDGADEPA